MKTSLHGFLKPEKTHIAKERLGKKNQICKCTYGEKYAPQDILKYRLNIQFRKENADGTTINILTLCKLALLSEIPIPHSA